jgi:hypothetical protein
MQNIVGVLFLYSHYIILGKQLKYTLIDYEVNKITEDFKLHINLKQFFLIFALKSHIFMLIQNIQYGPIRVAFKICLRKRRTQE